MEKTKNIVQKVKFKCTPEALYNALLDSRQHAKFTGAPAKMSKTVGGKFTAYGDYISGVNLDLKENERIVQAWRASEWPAGSYSVVAYEITPDKNGAALLFTHIGVPEPHVKGITQGWHDFYWEPLRKLLEA